jgi:hypothetical protein
MADLFPEGSESGPPRPSADADEPEIRGTLFIMLLFMMALVGFWILMYLRLLEV